MVYLSLAVAVFGGITLLNLLLTFGVIRRLREHTALLDRQAAGGSGMLPPMLPAGAAAPAYITMTDDGRRIDSAALGDEVLIGFLSPTCSPCKAQLPVFVDLAARLGGSVTVLAVVLDETGSAEMVDRLSPVARVVSEKPDGAIQSAFRVTAFPSFAFVANGVVRAAGSAVDEVAPPVAV